MKGLANTLRDLERIHQGECDELNDGARELLVFALQDALNRANNPPPKRPANILSLPTHKNPHVGNTPSRTSFSEDRQ